MVIVRELFFFFATTVSSVTPRDRRCFERAQQAATLAWKFMRHLFFLDCSVGQFNEFVSFACSSLRPFSSLDHGSFSACCCLWGFAALSVKSSWWVSRALLFHIL